MSFRIIEFNLESAEKVQVHSSIVFVVYSALFGVWQNGIFRVHLLKYGSYR